MAAQASRYRTDFPGRSGSVEPQRRRHDACARRSARCDRAQARRGGAAASVRRADAVAARGAPRIGRDLHDSTGQSLAALEIGLSELLRQTASLSAEARQQLEDCIRLAGQCSTEIRTASYLLHPPLLDELGLVSALRWLADGLRARSGLDVRLQLPEDLERLPAEEELAFFRVAQEALTNVHRHSSSPWAALRLSERTGELVLEVEDGGQGISHPSSQAEEGPGLGVGVMGMRERIRQLGGAFSVESMPTGTLIRASLPLVSTRAALPGYDSMVAAGL